VIFGVVGGCGGGGGGGDIHKKRERKRNRYMSTKCNNAGNFASTVRFIRLGHHSRCNAFYLHYHYDLFIFLGTRNALYFRF